jgi:hypothetical protein
MFNFEFIDCLYNLKEPDSFGCNDIAPTSTNLKKGIGAENKCGVTAQDNNSFINLLKYF